MDQANQKVAGIFKKFFVLLSWLFFGLHASSALPEPSLQTPVFQSENLYQWGTISSFHGLPSEKVNAIAQTPDGILWFATDKGLAKFDGRRVQTITAQNLSILRILELRILKNGELWIGTESGAFHLQNEVFLPLEETRNYSIGAIYESDTDEAIYLSGEKGSIFVVQKESEQGLKVTQILDSGLEIKDISQRGEELIFGTQKRGILALVKSKLSELDVKPPIQFINKFAKNKAGELWLGVQTTTENSGLYRSKNADEFEKIDAAVGSVTSLSFDRMGNLWVGTKDRGGFQFTNNQQTKRFTFENTAGGLRSNEILSTFVDRENVIWFGTTKGVCRFDPTSPINEKLSEDIQSNFVRTLFRTRSGELLAGTNRGLFIKNAENSWQELPGFKASAIYAIAEDNSGKLQIGASTGFYSDFDLTARNQTQLAAIIEKQITEKDSVRSIERFKGKTYLAFFGRGFANFDSSGLSFDQNNQNLTEIISLHNENDTTLWIGTSKDGVFSFDGKQISQIPILNALKNVAIWSIDGGFEKGVWFGTESGLFVLQNGDLKKVLADTDVRNVKVISDANGSGQSIWCATVNGLIKVVGNEDFGWIFSKINVEQGLSSQSTFAILPQIGKKETESILVGTSRGIASYSATEFRPLVVPTRILSKRLHSNSELKGGIDLEYPQNSLALEVAGLSSRTFPEQFQYAFVLRNSKGEAINKKLSNDSQFVMENLTPGVYSVETVAFDKNLTPSEPLVFSFSIASAPFPWTTLALTILLALAIVALIWAAFSQRRISRTSSELEFANKELSTARLDLANEAERERRRISRDLHDQTLADLRHLLLLTDKLPTNEESDENAAVFRSEIENVSNEIRNICEALSPSVLENIGFTASLEWALDNAVRDSERIASSAFLCDEISGERISLTPSVQIQIYRIVQEVLSNIVQHSTATSIKLTIHESQNMKLRLTIEDNGSAFDGNQRENSKGRGIPNIQARANLIEAATSWKPNENGGNTFELEHGKSPES